MSHVWQSLSTVTGGDIHSSHNTPGLTMIMAKMIFALIWFFVVIDVVHMKTRYLPFHVCNFSNLLWVILSFKIYIGLSIFPSFSFPSFLLTVSMGILRLGWKVYISPGHFFFCPPASPRFSLPMFPSPSVHTGLFLHFPSRWRTFGLLEHHWLSDRLQPTLPNLGRIRWGLP